MNLTIDARAYDLLQRYAPTRKSYGRFLSTLIEEYDESQRRDELRQRIERLEDQVARLARRQAFCALLAQGTEVLCARVKAQQKIKYSFSVASILLAFHLLLFTTPRTLPTRASVWPLRSSYRYRRMQFLK